MAPSFAKKAPFRHLLTQHSLWAMAIAAIASSSVLLGFAVSMNIESPVHTPTTDDNKCDNSNNAVFWQMLAQLLLHVLIVLCLVVPVVRDHEGWIRIHNFWFTSACFVSIFSAIIGFVLYATVCGSNGWLANLLLGWAGSVTAVAAAAQLAAGLRRG